LLLNISCSPNVSVPMQCPCSSCWYLDACSCVIDVVESDDRQQPWRGPHDCCGRWRHNGRPE
jgi:hypothetical protein